jgi:hypothetical protein
MGKGNGDSSESMDELRRAIADLESRLMDRQDQFNGRLGDVQNQLNMLGPALAGLAGLDGIAKGVSELVGVLAPLRNLGNEPQPLEGPVVAAIDRIRAAIGPEIRPIDRVPVPDASISFIGQP